MYLSFVLSEASRKAILEGLKEMWLIEGEVDDFYTDDGINDIYCNHVMLYYNPTFKDMQALLNEYGESITVIAEDVYAIGEAGCIKCSVNGKHTSLDGREFHITLWCRKYMKPAYSNIVMEENDPCENFGPNGLVLTGEVKLVN